MRWYDGVYRTLEVFSGIFQWSTPGHEPVAIKWVVTRDPEGNFAVKLSFLPT
jgi:hypothetical protein